MVEVHESGRIARLEEKVEHLTRKVQGIKQDVRELREETKSLREEIHKLRLLIVIVIFLIIFLNQNALEFIFKVFGLIKQISPNFLAFRSGRGKDERYLQYRLYLQTGEKGKD